MYWVITRFIKVKSSPETERIRKSSAALPAGPYFKALQCQFGELPCLYSFIGVAQIECDLFWCPRPYR